MGSGVERTHGEVAAGGLGSEVVAGGADSPTFVCR